MKTFTFMMFKDYYKAQVCRMKLFAKYAKGLVLDVGGSQLPNPFFDFSDHVQQVWLLDIEKPLVKLPKKYSKVILFNLDDLDKPLPFSNNTFDTIVLGEILEHLYNPFRVLNECRRILKDGGILLISTPTPKYYIELLYMILFSKPMLFPEHKQLFTRCQMKYMLKTLGFKIIKIIGYNFWVPLLKLGFVNTGSELIELFTWQQIYIAHKEHEL